MGSIDNEAVPAVVSPELLVVLAIETVAKRVNARPATIRRHYYKATEREEFEELRAEKTLKLDIEDNDE